MPHAPEPSSTSALCVGLGHDGEVLQDVGSCWSCKDMSYVMCSVTTGKARLASGPTQSIFNFRELGPRRLNSTSVLPRFKFGDMPCSVQSSSSLPATWVALRITASVQELLTHMAVSSIHVGPKNQARGCSISVQEGPGNHQSSCAGPCIANGVRLWPTHN